MTIPKSPRLGRGTPRHRDFYVYGHGYVNSSPSSFIGDDHSRFGIQSAHPPFLQAINIQSIVNVSGVGPGSLILDRSKIQRE